MAFSPLFDALFYGNAQHYRLIKLDTQPLRRRLWGIHTGKMGAQDNPADAFDQWERIIKRNADNQIKGLAPYASLAGFIRTSTSRLRLD